MIRVMTIEDYAAVYALWLNTQGMGLNDLDDSRAGIAGFLRRNPETCFVAEEEGRVVGVILAGHDGRRGHIYHTAVAETERKKGWGRALVQASLAALAAEGIHKVALVVFAKNETGNDFWENSGFTQRNDLIYRNKALSEMRRIDL